MAHKNGISLGEIVVAGTAEAGNYGSACGTAAGSWGVLPSDAGGGFTDGGEYAPRLLHTRRRVAFSSSASKIAWWDPAGACGWSVGALAAFAAKPPPGAVLVTNGHASVPVRGT